MIKRDLEPIVINDAKHLPVVAILGPRQSGKTTLARAAFKKHTYVSMEEPSTREAALEDPRGFLSTYAKKGAIFDEVQRVPDLLSYIQTYVDLNKGNGRFILTGS